jgi:hypothetical protein
LFDSLILHSPLVGERQMLFERLDRLGSQDMLVLDRGYPGRWLVAVLLQRGIPFCMRCDSSSTFVGHHPIHALRPGRSRGDIAAAESPGCRRL